MGINLYTDEQLLELAEQVNAAVRSDWRAGPLVPGAKPSTAATVEVTSPADRRQLVGHWQPAAAIGDMYEIEASQIAVDRAKSAEVKAFARQMIMDHSKTSQKLE